MFRAIRVKHYIACMKALGFAPEAVLAGSEIKLNRLAESDYLIDIWQSQRVIANIIALTHNEAIAFEFGKYVSHPDLGVVGYALMSCKSMSAAIDLWLNYSHTLVGMLVTASGSEQKEGWSLTFTEAAPIGRLFQFCVEENLVFGVRLMSDMFGTPLQLSKIELAYPKPAHHRCYEKAFNCPIKFDAGVSRMTIRSPAITAPMKGYDSDLYQACMAHCAHLLRSVSAEQPVAYQIRNQLIGKPGNIPSLTQVAALLNYSPRNLRRLLSNEGVSYQRLVNDYRCELAKEYVKASNLSNKEIGYLLGYEETKAFLAAFKGWTGMSMSEYRNKAR